MQTSETNLSWSKLKQLRGNEYGKKNLKFKQLNKTKLATRDGRKAALIALTKSCMWTLRNPELPKAISFNSLGLHIVIEGPKK